jgi:hypothetical protein
MRQVRLSVQHICTWKDDYFVVEFLTYNDEPRFSETVPDSRTTAPQYCEAVPGGLVFKARRLLYHSTLGRE